MCLRSLVPNLLEVVTSKLPLEASSVTARQRRAARSLAAPAHSDASGSCEGVSAAEQAAALLLQDLGDGEPWLHVQQEMLEYNTSYSAVW